MLTEDHQLRGTAFSQTHYFVIAWIRQTGAFSQLPVNTLSMGQVFILKFILQQ